MVNIASDNNDVAIKALKSKKKKHRAKPKKIEQKLKPHTEREMMKIAYEDGRQPSRLVQEVFYNFNKFS